MSICGCGWLRLCFTDHKGKILSRRLFLLFVFIVMTHNEGMREMDSCERGTLLENETLSREESNLPCSIDRYYMVYALVPE